MTPVRLEPAALRSRVCMLGNSVVLLSSSGDFFSISTSLGSVRVLNSLDSNQDRLDVLKCPNIIAKVISRRKNRRVLSVKGIKLGLKTDESSL